MRVFVSYTVRDGYWTEDRLRRVREALSEHGDLFIDGLAVPRPDQEAVMAMLRDSDVFLILASPQYAASPWTNKEHRLAKALGKRIAMFRHDPDFDQEHLLDAISLASANEQKS